MDGEGSYESDVSESWSLIDINVNVESHSAAESPKLEKDFTIKLENRKSKKKNLSELKDEMEKYDEVHSEDYLIGSGSESNSLFANNDCMNDSIKELDQDWSTCQTYLRINERNDADEVESIEILDVDGNYRDSESERLESVFNSHDSQTCQSDDEDSVEECLHGACKSHSLTFVKGRRPSRKNSDGAINFVNSGEKCEKNNLRVLKESGGRKNELKSKSSGCFQGVSHAVYKHYRNNFANTVLNLSVGVIFAGVACMAIGHFLGVQDAAETAGELVETLKKLQVENAALQSRLFHMNRAFLNREGNPRLESPSNKVSCEESRHVTSRAREADPKSSGAAPPEIHSSWNSMERLSELEDSMRSGDKAAENTVDLKGFGLYIHDQLNILNKRKQNGLKLLEDADRKISNVLPKIVTRMSTFQENIENLYNKLINLKSNLNQKLNKVIPEIAENVRQEKSESDERASAATESFGDLHSWRRNRNSKITENSLGDSERRETDIQFPQPEKYYRVEFENLKNIRENSQITNSSETLKKTEEKEKKGKSECQCGSEKRRGKKVRKVSRKEESKKNEMKRRKGTESKLVTNRTEKRNKKKNRVTESRAVKKNYGHELNETSSRRSKRSDLKADFLKAKGKLKKMKKSKVKKCLPPSQVQKGSWERYGRSCLGHRCSNSTGYWVFRWAGGREEYRRHRLMGEWQFDRARGREDLRKEGEGEGEGNWQMRRGWGREESRQSGSGSGSGRWSRGKELFHDWWSWI